MIAEMSPIDQIREDNLVDLKRHNTYNNEIDVLRRDSDGGSGKSNGGDGKKGSSGGGDDRNKSGSGSKSGSDSNSKATNTNDNSSNKETSEGGNSGSGSKGESGSGSDSGKGGSNGNGNGNNNGNGGGSGNKNGNGGKKAVNSPDNPPSKQTSSELPPAARTTSTALTTVPTTIPTTVVVTSTAIADTLSPPPTLSLIPTTVAPGFSTPTFTYSVDSSSQPRKGLNTDEDPTTTSTKYSTSGTTASTETSLILPETVLAPTTTSLPLPPETRPSDISKGGSISPLAERLLIAAGTIGAFVIVIAVVYLLFKRKKIDVFAPFRNREFKKGGPKGWYGWRSKNDLTSLSASRFTNSNGAYGYPSDEKPIPPLRQLDAFYSPVAKPPLATPQNAATLSSADIQRKDIVREAFSSPPPPFEASSSMPAPIPQDTNHPTQDYYTYDSNQNNTYNTYNTNNTYLTQNTADVYDPAQREVNHLSYLSSLSSGFGDAQIIIPETTPPKQNTQDTQQSSRQSSTQLLP